MDRCRGLAGRPARKGRGWEGARQSRRRVHLLPVPGGHASMFHLYSRTWRCTGPPGIHLPGSFAKQAGQRGRVLGSSAVGSSGNHQLREHALSAHSSGLSPSPKCRWRTCGTAPRACPACPPPTPTHQHTYPHPNTHMHTLVPTLDIPIPSLVVPTGTTQHSMVSALWTRAKPGAIRPA